MNDTIDNYRRAHEFYRQTKLELLGMEVEDWKRLFEYTQSKSVLEEKMKEKKLEKPLFFMAASLSKTGTEFFQEKFSQEYASLKTELDHYRSCYRALFQSKVQELQSRLEAYPLCKTAIDVLCERNVVIEEEDMRILGSCEIEKYLIYINSQLAGTERDITLLHEVGHLFYAFPALPAENDYFFRRPEIHPIEALLDREAERALQRDQGLAGYLLEKAEMGNRGEKFI